MRTPEKLWRAYLVWCAWSTRTFDAVYVFNISISIHFSPTQNL